MVYLFSLSGVFFFFFFYKLLLEKGCKHEYNKNLGNIPDGGKKKLIKNLCSTAGQQREFDNYQNKTHYADFWP